MNEKPLRIRLKMKGGKNSVIPPGAIEQIMIDIVDGIAVYHFIDNKTNKKFCESQNKEGIESKFVERLNKTFCKYPGMNKQQISEHIIKRLKELSKNER
jgi:hypothetical protein